MEIYVVKQIYKRIDFSLEWLPSAPIIFTEIFGAWSNSQE